jgi:PIN domain nuclease of toxin-antitoxin system
MARQQQSLVYLDTHIVVWLFAGLTEKLSENAKREIEERDVYISQMVRLELQYLYEIGRIKVKPHVILKNLSKAINLKVSNAPVGEIIDEALKIDWTRDVFDRLLIAEARVKGSSFITADESIRHNFKKAVW